MSACTLFQRLIPARSRNLCIVAGSMLFPIIHCIMCASLAVVASRASALPTMSSFEWIEDFPADAFGITPIAVNANGDFAGSFLEPKLTGGIRGVAFAYAGGVVRPIRDSLGGSADATGINDAGVVVGYFGGGDRAFRSAGGSTVTVINLGEQTWLYDINEAGVATGARRDSLGNQFMLRQPGSDFAELVPSGHRALRINSQGTVAGVSAADTSVFIDKNGTLTFLGVPPSTNPFFIEVNDINDAERLVGTGSTMSVNGFADDFAYKYDGQFELLPALPGRDNSSAGGIDESGHIVGGSYNQNSVDSRAVVWIDDVVFDLNDIGGESLLNGELLLGASDIAENGWVVGVGERNGTRVPWRAQLAFGSGDFYWIDEDGGSFEQGANWDAGKAPQASDRAIFDLNNTYEVTFSAANSPEVDTFEIRGGSVAFAAGKFTAGTAIVGAAGGAEATLVLDAIDLETHGAIIGQDENAIGHVNMVSEATWVSDANETVVVGDAGVGDLRTESGGMATENLVAGRETTGIGVLAFEGEHTVLHSGDLTLGDSGQGSLLLTNGARATSDLAVLGRSGEEASLGVANIRGFEFTGTDPTTWVVNNTLVVGDHGRGIVNIEDGALVTSAGGLIGVQKGNADAGGEVYVHGASPNLDPSKWQIANDLILGQESGVGHLTIEDGGFVQATYVDVGFGSDGSGFVRVDGVMLAGGEPFSATLNVTDNLVVGTSGHGELQIDNGGEVRALNITLGANFDTNSNGLLLVRGRDDLTLFPSSLKVEEDLIVGHTGQGHFVVDSGADVESFNGFIGVQQGNPASKGIAEIRGTDADGRRARWRIEDQLVAGAISGNGVLKILDGAAVSSEIGVIAAGATSSGEVIVSGTSIDGLESVWTNATEMEIGREGTGRLEISGGGYVTTESAVIGARANDGDVADGTVNLGGVSSAGPAPAPSTFDVEGLLTIGDQAHGKLLVDQGARVDAAIVYAAMASSPQSKGDITVTGSDAANGLVSTLRTEDEIVVGFGGVGSLFIGGGARVISRSGTVANEATAVGTVQITGMNADELKSGWVVDDEIIIGGAGSGELHVAAGGIAGAKNFIFGDEEDSQGKLFATGSLSNGIHSGIVATDRVEIAAFGVGRAELNDGGFIEAYVITIGELGEVTGHDGMLIANQVINDGIIAPGLSPGQLIIDGNLNQFGILEIEIAGQTPVGEYDVLTITGNATIEGDVLLRFIDGFAPQQGQQFEFLQVDGMLDATDANFAIENLAPGFEFNIASTASGLRLVALNDGHFVPEPASWVLVAIGLLAAVRVRTPANAC